MKYFVTGSGLEKNVQTDPRLNTTSNQRVVFLNLGVLFSYWVIRTTGQGDVWAWNLHSRTPHYTWIDFSRRAGVWVRSWLPKLQIRAGKAPQIFISAKPGTRQLCERKISLEVWRRIPPRGIIKIGKLWVVISTRSDITENVWKCCVVLLVKRLPSILISLLCWYLPSQVVVLGNFKDLMICINWYDTR